MEPPRVLLSAYACEPGKGSEPGVGWRWACGLSSRVSLSVITRESNRSSIEKAIHDSPPGDPIRSASFLYHDLEAPILWLKRKRVLSTGIYYILWQYTAARKFRDIAENSDIVHHLTFCTLLCPGFWKLRRARFVLGPVGAPVVDPRHLKLFGGGAWGQWVRNLLVMNFHRIPWLRKLLKDASAVVPANSATRELLIARGIPAQEVMLDTGAPETSSAVLHDRTHHDEACRFIFAGRLEKRKGLELSLRAFALAMKNADFNGTFRIIGNGPDQDRLEKLTRLLDLRDRCTFIGAVPREKVMVELRNADVFLFTSLRDTSAGVNLEAMASGLPVVCLSHQGVADITDQTCAMRIQPDDIETTIRDLAGAMMEIADNHDLRKRLGDSARQRANRDFCWDDKFDAMCRYYDASFVRT